MTDLSTFAELASVDHGRCVFSTLRGDGSAQASVVNAGVLQHPLTGVQVVGLVATGAARKLRNLRADPRATIVARAGWQWAAVEGSAQLIGLDDPTPMSMTNNCGCCFAPSSPQLVEPTTTGTPTTG